MCINREFIFTKNGRDDKRRARKETEYKRNISSYDMVFVIHLIANVLDIEDSGQNNAIKKRGEKMKVYFSEKAFNQNIREGYFNIAEVKGSWVAITEIVHGDANPLSVFDDLVYIGKANKTQLVWFNRQMQK